MKNVLVVYNSVPPKDSHLAIIEKGLGSNYRLSKNVLVDFEFWVRDNRLKVITPAGKDLKSFDAIFFAKWTRFQIAAAAATYLKKHRVAFKPSEVGDYPPVSKLGEAVLLADNDLPLPNAVIASVRNIAKNTSRYTKGFKFPLVLKHTDSSFGNDNFLVGSVDDLKTKIANYGPNDFFIIQQYIPNSSDFRCLVFNAKAEVLLQRVRTGKKSYLNNTRKGARAEVVDPIPPQIKKMSEKAAKITGRSDLAGVDIIYDQVTGRPYVIEVNKTPVVLQKTPFRPEKNKAVAKFIRSI